MDKNQFVSALGLVVEKSAVEDVIENLEDPPGRAPSQKLLDMSRYYLSKSDMEKEMIGNIIKEVAGHMMFGFLCVLDGVRDIEDGEGDLVLIYRNKDKVVLNKDADLHDIYNSK